MFSEPNFPASVTGELLTIHDISKEQAGIYECLAFNGVPPTAVKNITVNVECKNLEYLLFLSFKNIIKHIIYNTFVYIKCFTKIPFQ